MNDQKILIIDDESDILELLEYNLSKEGYIIKTALSGLIGIKIAKSFLPDLIILDIMMPEQDGIETCRQIKSIPGLANAFIIFLTARSEEYSEVAAFDMGADDYITKPIKPRALMSRINALFKRETKKGDTNIIIIDELEIDRSSYSIRLRGNKIQLPKKEFELIFYLAQNPGKVFSRDDLLYKIWGTDVYVLPRTIDVHIRKVREKIGDKYISTIKGVGYKLEVN